MASRFDSMTRKQLNDWYEQEVGYRPDEDNGARLPLSELREMCASYEQAVWDNDPFFKRRCPKCGAGTMQRNPRGGWLCSSFPNCQHTTDADPAGA